MANGLYFTFLTMVYQLYINSFGHKKIVWHRLKYKNDINKMKKTNKSTLDNSPPPLLNLTENCALETCRANLGKLQENLLKL